MVGDPTGNSNRYLRAALITSTNPRKPLEGTTVALNSTLDVPELDEPHLGDLIREAHERFDIDSYATRLRLGTVYFDDSARDLVGVSWEESPRPHGHREFDEPISDIPDDMMSAEEFL